MRSSISSIYQLMFAIHLTAAVAFATASGNSDRPAALTALAEQEIDRYLDEEHWEAVRNLSGVANAVFIVPSGGQAGLLVGAQWGRGILMVRRNQSWSDPVFIKLKAAQVGFLAGGQKVRGIGAVLSSKALEKVLSGKGRIGGSADLTLFRGVSGRAGGGLGGIEILMVSSNTGLYLGGTFEGLWIYPDDNYNRLAYGADVEIADIIARNRSVRYGPSVELRKKLHKAAQAAVFNVPETVDSE